MNEKHIQESTNCPYKSFRDFNRKLVEVKSNSEEFDNFTLENQRQLEEICSIISCLF